MFNWIDKLYHTVTGKIDQTVADWVHALIHGLYAFLASIFGPVARAWDAFWRDISGYVQSGLLFASHVVTLLHDAFAWINKEGYEVYYYITHPSKLVDLLWSFILTKFETDSVHAAEKLGTFFLHLLVRNLKTVLHVLEDIVDAVL